MKTYEEYCKMADDIFNLLNAFASTKEERCGINRLTAEDVMVAETVIEGIPLNV